MKKIFSTKRSRIILLTTLITLTLIFLFSFFYKKDLVHDEVTVELGSKSVGIDIFLKEENENAVFISGLDNIDLNKIGEYPLEIKIGRHTYSTKLIVKDTTKPVLVLKENLGIQKGVELPIEFFVEKVDDLSKYTLKYLIKPDFKKLGKQKIQISAIDDSGNETTKDTFITVLNINTNLFIELGSKTKLEKEDFLYDSNFDLNNLEFITDINSIDLNTIGKHEIEVKFNNDILKLALEINDTLPPTANPVKVSKYIGQQILASDFVEDIEDASKVEVFFETKPDINKAGNQEIKLILKDEAGNETKISSTLELKKDETPPVIYGAKNINIQDSKPYNWLSGVYAEDNVDGKVKVNVDHSKVNINKEGTYTLYYSATDKAGNTAKKEVKVTVDFVTPYSPSGSTGNSEVNKLADNILSQIINNDLSQSEKIRRIYNWVTYQIPYSYFNSTNFVDGAIQGLRYRTGNCYVHANTLTALLKRIGVNAYTEHEYGYNHSWTRIGEYVLDPTVSNVLNNYYVPKKNLENVVFSGTWIYRTYKSDPPKTSWEEKKVYKNKRDINFGTVYKLNPNSNSSYPDKVLAKNGVKGVLAEMWTQKYKNGSLVTAYILEKDYVLKEPINEEYYIGTKLNPERKTTKKSTFIDSDENYVKTKNKSLDGKTVENTGTDEITEISKFVTAIDSKTGKATKYSNPVQTVIQTYVAEKRYKYVEPSIENKTEEQEIPIETIFIETEDPELDGEVIDEGSAGLKTREVTTTTWFDGTTDVSYSEWSIKKEMINKQVYKLKTQ